MRRTFRTRNLLLLVLLSLIFWCVEFAFRKNNICSVEDRPIQSELDAIDVAKKKVVKDSFFISELLGSAYEFVESLVDAENCCSAERTRNVFGVIVWSVYLTAKATAKYNRRTIFVEMDVTAHRGWRLLDLCEAPTSIPFPRVDPIDCSIPNTIRRRQEESWLVFKEVRQCRVTTGTLLNAPTPRLESSMANR